MNNGLIKSEIKLTIGILVSNRIQYIRRCMESLKPLLEQVPSELIAVDTKGVEGDGSIDIVREYTDKIYPFTWCDDFSAARNVCMEHARGEWFLYLDDDEYFDDVQEFIDFFQSGESEQFQSGYYRQKNYASDGGFSFNITGRMIRRRQDTCFIGRIHEGFNEVYGPEKQFHTFVHHYGYMFENEESRKEHQNRNVQLLRQELATQGLSPRYCAQLVQELLAVADTREEGFRLCMEYVGVLAEKNMLQDACTQWMLIAGVRYYFMQERYKETLAQAEYIEKKYPLSETARQALAAIVVQAAVELSDIERIKKYVSVYMSMKNWRQEHPREALIQTQLDFPKYDEEELYQKMLEVERQIAEQEVKKASGKRPIPIKSKIKLTIGILISNRIEYIRQCMEALKPLLDTVPSELIAVDTKGAETDGSIDIVREYTDKIYPFTWCGDFAAARNVTIEHARGEWYMFLDDDEIFDDVQEFIDFFQSGESEKYYSGFYYVRNHLPDGTYVMELAGRMIRRMENTCFVGRVHETFNESYAPNKQFQSFVHHYGYRYQTAEEERRHQQRNLSLLKEEITEKGMLPNLCAEMVQEYFALSSTMEEGFAFCLKSIDVLQESELLSDSCSQWLLVASVRYYHSSKKYEEAVRRADFVRKAYPLNEMAKLALAAVAAESALLCGNSLSMVQYTLIYQQAKQWLEEHPEEALLQTQLDFPRFQTQPYLVIVLCAGAVGSNAMGQYELAYQYWQQMPWDEMKDADCYKEPLLQTLQNINDKEPLREFYRHFYKKIYFLPENEGYLPKECRGVKMKPEV